LDEGNGGKRFSGQVISFLQFESINPAQKASDLSHWRRFGVFFTVFQRHRVAQNKIFVATRGQSAFNNHQRKSKSRQG
jgi:hypothetical protein